MLNNNQIFSLCPTILNINNTNLNINCKYSKKTLDFFKNKNNNKNIINKMFNNYTNHNFIIKTPLTLVFLRITIYLNILIKQKLNIKLI
jgi:hypothetical protein